MAQAASSAQAPLPKTRNVTSKNLYISYIQHLAVQVLSLHIYPFSASFISPDQEQFTSGIPTRSYVLQSESPSPDLTGGLPPQALAGCSVRSKTLDSFLCSTIIKDLDYHVLTYRRPDEKCSRHRQRHQRDVRRSRL